MYAVELNYTVGDVKQQLRRKYNSLPNGDNKEICALSYFSVILKDDVYLYMLPDIRDNPITVHVTNPETCEARLSYGEWSVSCYAYRCPLGFWLEAV
jgi:hypothetical protein